MIDGNRLGSDPGHSGEPAPSPEARKSIPPGVAAASDAAPRLAGAPRRPVLLAATKSSFAAGEAVVVNFFGFEGAPDDAIVLARTNVEHDAKDAKDAKDVKDGSDAPPYEQRLTTGGAPSGYQSFSGVPSGSYIARAYSGTPSVAIAESEPFVVRGAVATPTLVLDKRSYEAFESIVVRFANMPGARLDRVALVRAGTTATAMQGAKMTSPAKEGVVTFKGTPPGRYEVRAVPDPQSGIAQVSTEFSVTGTLPTPSVATDKTIYDASEAIVVTFASMAGYKRDWLALARDGSEEGVFIESRYTGGVASGKLSFRAPSAGTYRIHAYFDNNTHLRASSPPFTVA